MKKLIAKTLIGSEFLHSRNAWFVTKNANRIVKKLNEMELDLNPGEKWYVYDYDSSQEFYVKGEIFMGNDMIIYVEEWDKCVTN